MHRECFATSPTLVVQCYFGLGMRTWAVTLIDLRNHYQQVLALQLKDT